MWEQGSPQAEGCREHGVDAARVALARHLLLADEVYLRLADTFRVLADPTRAKIVHSLYQQDLCTCDLAAVVGLSEPAVSQHLRMLRQLRVVRSRREGKVVYYSLHDEHVRTLLAVALTHLRHGEQAGGPGSTTEVEATHGS